MTRRSWVTVTSLLGLLVLVSGYLALGVMKLNPLADRYVVHIELRNSGGLLDRSEVTYRGHPVGRVRQIRLAPDQVTVDVAIDSRYRIPADARVVVANLSVAGEQYLDFRPAHDAGPYLQDGDVVRRGRTTTPVPFAELLATMTRMAGQVEPDELKAIVDELDRALAGSADDLAAVVDGGALLVNTVVDLLPETRRLLRRGPVVLGTMADLRDELGRFARAGSSLGAGLAGSDSQIRGLIDEAPALAGTLDKVMDENGPALVSLLGDLTTTSEILVARLPSLRVYLPWLARAASTVGEMAQGDHLLALADAFPRDSCDYGSPRHPATETNTGGPLLNRYCGTRRTDIQQRGAHNAPRPAGDDTARPTPGADPLERPSWW